MNVEAYVCTELHQKVLDLSVLGPIPLIRRSACLVVVVRFRNHREIVGK